MNKKTDLWMFVLYVVAAICIFVVGVFQFSQNVALGAIFVVCGCVIFAFGMVHLARLLKADKAEKAEKEQKSDNDGQNPPRQKQDLNSADSKSEKK